MAPAGQNRAVMLALLACLFSLAITCHGHGFLLSPLSRARVIGRAEWEAAGGNGLGAQPFRTYSPGILLNDQADVCGDPHQDVGDLSLRSTITAVQATYTAGQTISISYRMTVNHGGWLGAKICPSTRVNPTQACFDQHTLVNADTGFKRWWIQTGSYGTQTTYTTKWRLPVGVTCDGGCVLQMIYRTANSCVDECSAAECGPVYAARRVPVAGVSGSTLDKCGPYGNPSTPPRTEVFRDCADIRIVRSNGGRASPPVRAPPPPPVRSSSSPPPPPARSSSSPPPPASNCGGQTAAAFCSGKPIGFYGDKCTSCTKYYWCYGTGAMYMSCGAGTAMDSRGKAGGCDYPSNIVC